MQPIPDIVVSLASGVDSAVVQELLSSLQAAELTTGVEQRDDEVYASVEWMVPTAVVVWLAEKYFGSMVEEAGKRHYEAAREAWERLVRRTTRPESEITRIALVSRQSPNKLRQRELPGLSVLCPLRSGRRVKFVFEHSLSESKYATAIEAMHGLMVRHQRSPDGGDLVAELIVQGVSDDREAVLRFNDAQGRWVAWNPRPR